MFLLITVEHTKTTATALSTSAIRKQQVSCLGQSHLAVRSIPLPGDAFFRIVQFFSESDDKLEGALAAPFRFDKLPAYHNSAPGQSYTIVSTS